MQSVKDDLYALQIAPCRAEEIRFSLCKFGRSAFDEQELECFILSLENHGLMITLVGAC